MSKRIVDIGDLHEGALAELGDVDIEGDDELAAIGGERMYTEDEARQAFQSGSMGGFALGALVGGLVGFGVGAAGGVFIGSRYAVKAR